MVLGAETSFFGLKVFQPTPTPIVTSVPTPTCQNAAAVSNPVAAENLCAGTDSWKSDQPTGPDNAIEGFTSPASVVHGGTIQVYVSTTAPTYTMLVYRMGWYQGHGGRLMLTLSPLAGINQPPPLIEPTTHMVSCRNWTHPVALHVPSSWVSGFYIIKFVSSAGYIRYTPFVVRDDLSRAPIIVTSSFITYQAYNLWGGYNLYRGLDASGNMLPSERALAVSFDRPYNEHEGLMDFVAYESGLLRWLEREGYNITYSTDEDSGTRGSLLLHHRLIIVAGHDEYWSTAMRQNITAARDRGISLAFFGADDSYWHIRMQATPLGPDREVVCYKHGYVDDGSRNTTDPVAATRPLEATGLWRDAPLNQPENSLLGQMYHGGVVSGNALVLRAGSAPFLSGTGLPVGSALPGLVGGEYDQVSYNGKTPPHLVVLAASQVSCRAGEFCPANGIDVATATLYSTPRGAKVFDAGTFRWGMGLDPGFNTAATTFVNAGFQRYTTNLLNYLLAPASN